MEDINRRNTAAVGEALAQLTQRVYDMQVKIDGLVSTTSTQSTRISQLEHDLAIVRAKAMGNGPTT